MDPAGDWTREAPVEAIRRALATILPASTA
jgi:hypothetical protein